MDKQTIRQTIIEYAALCYSKGLVSAAGGNISMRLGDSVFITATNAPLRRLAPEDIVEMDMQGNPIGDSNGRKPSKEWGMHLAVFQNRPDADSVIHIHPVYSVAASAACGEPFALITVSAQLKLKEIGYVPFAKPGSKELLDGVSSVIQEDHTINSILLERHGILTIAAGMEQCFSTAELMEESAKVAYLSATLKSANENGGSF